MLCFFYFSLTIDSRVLFIDSPVIRPALRAAMQAAHEALGFSSEYYGGGVVLFGKGVGKHTVSGFGFAQDLTDKDLCPPIAMSSSTWKPLRLPCPWILQSGVGPT